MKTYHIKPEYKARTSYVHYDDSNEEDGWQLEVYLHALALMIKHHFHSIADIGCGSGYKLATYFENYAATGYELPINVELLKQKYPAKEWLVSDFSQTLDRAFDVVICSDVIEHLVDPDNLLHYLNRIDFKYLVLSTPERDLVYKPGQSWNDGPPRNPTHQREWNKKEFAEYISEFFTIIDHRVTNLEQATQMIICVKK